MCTQSDVCRLGDNARPSTHRRPLGETTRRSARATGQRSGRLSIRRILEEPRSHLLLLLLGARCGAGQQPSCAGRAGMCMRQGEGGEHHHGDSSAGADDEHHGVLTQQLAADAHDCSGSASSAWAGGGKSYDSSGNNILMVVCCCLLATSQRAAAGRKRSRRLLLAIIVGQPTDADGGPRY